MAQQEIVFESLAALHTTGSVKVYSLFPRSEPRAEMNRHRSTDLQVPYPVDSRKCSSMSDDDGAASVREPSTHKRTLATSRQRSLDRLYATADAQENSGLQTQTPPKFRSPDRMASPMQINIPVRRSQHQEDRQQQQRDGLQERRQENREFRGRHPDRPHTSSDNHSILQESLQRPHTAKSSTVQSPTSEDSRSNSPGSVLTSATSLPALQQKGMNENDQLEPLMEEDLEPGSFDLVAPRTSAERQYSLEKRSEQLFSTEHLRIIFSDPSLLLRFTAFLSSNRVSSIPILIYYLDAMKALKAISYSNAIAEALEPIEGINFTKNTITSTINADLHEKARQAFEVMVREDLPAYVTHVYIQTVSLSIQRRVVGTLPVHLREASEGLAEVFCLTDPSRPDNPIVFSSDEFHRTTQYGMSYAIGRNCRFLQGPKTNPFSVKRIRDKIDAGKEHCEVFLNYRRDGSPFMNLLMIAPLTDSRGTIRYFIGAQVDVSGLVKECSDLESLDRLVNSDESGDGDRTNGSAGNEEMPKDEFQELSEMLNLQELDTVRRWGGRMHKNSYDDPEDSASSNTNWNQPRLVINSLSPTEEKLDGKLSKGRLDGIYENYLLVRPHPNLRILFASPSLRVPGILQSPFMNKIGGSMRVREELTQAFALGRGVTAKVRWISKTDPEGRARWIHCTPLVGNNNAVGVWMIVLVDDEEHNKRFRKAPVVDPRFGRSIPFHRGDGVAVSTAHCDAVSQASINSEVYDTEGGSVYTLRID